MFERLTKIMINNSQYPIPDLVKNSATGQPKPPIPTIKNFRIKNFFLT